MLKLSIRHGALAFALMACSSKAKTTTNANSDDVVLTGKMSVESGVARDVDVTQLELYCVTFTDPPIAGTGNVTSDTSFTLTLANAKGDAFGCFVRSASATDCGSAPSPCTLATVSFTNSAQTDASGNPLQQGSITLSGGTTALGTVIINPATGIAAVSIPTDNNAAATTSQATASSFDFTGSWTIHGLSPEPAGYASPCATGSNNCNGPQDGQQIYLKRVNGVTFTPDATCAAKVSANQFADSDTCAGTAGTAPWYGMMVWSDPTAIATCGNQLGFSYDQAKAFARADLSGSGLASGDLAWSTSANIDTVSQTITDGWKLSGATTSQDISNCYPSNGDFFCGGVSCSTGQCLQLTVLAQGHLCSDLAAGAIEASLSSDQIAVLTDECYANYYYSRQSQFGTLCMRQIQTNWGAGNASDFLVHDGPSRAITEFAVNAFTYTGPNSGTFVDEHEEFDNVQYTDGQQQKSASCRLHNSFRLNLTSVSTTSMVGDIQSETRVVDQNPVCNSAAAQSTLRVGTSRVMITLAKS